jgi:2'-5' RNA ligase
MASELLRAFIALEIEAGMRERMAAVMADLKRGMPEARFAPMEQLHLTLRFLGDVSRETLARMEPALGRAASECPALDATVKGLGTFPERGGPRVLWLGIDLPAPAFDLQAACEKAAVAAGLPRENRPFKAHLTLARWRGPARRPTLPEVDLGETRLARLILFRSELRPQGAVHTPLAEFELGSRA